MTVLTRLIIGILIGSLLGACGAGGAVPTDLPATAARPPLAVQPTQTPTADQRPAPTLTPAETPQRLATATPAGAPAQAQGVLPTRCVLPTEIAADPRAVTTLPATTIPISTRADLAMQTRDWAQAVTDYTLVLSQTEGLYGPAVSLRGRAYLKLYEQTAAQQAPDYTLLAQALADFQRGIALAPDGFDAYYNLTVAWAYIPNIQTLDPQLKSCTLAHASQAVRIQPTNKPALKHRGTIYLALGDPCSAIKDFRMATGEDRKSYPHALLELSKAYAQLGDWDEATRSLDTLEQIPAPDAEVKGLQGKVIDVRRELGARPAAPVITPCP